MGGVDDGSERPGWPRRVVEYLKGAEVRRTYYQISPGEERRIECQTVGAAWNAPDNLVTVTRKYVDGPFEGEIKSVFYPDGTVELHEFEIGGDGQRRTETVLRGAPNADRSGIVKGTKTVTVIGVGSEVLARQVMGVASGLVIEQEVHTTLDEAKRVHRVDYLDGTHETKTYGCCGQLESEVDHEGIETSYAYDALDRPVATTRNGITELLAFDPEGRVVGRTRQGRDGSQIVLEQNAYDLAGRLVSNVRAGRGKTETGYSVDASGTRWITTAYADGGQRIEGYARDGRVTGVTGSAVHPVRYWVDVELDGGVMREVFYEVKLDSAGNDTGEWTKQFKDPRARSYKKQYADGAAELSFYDGKGRLWKSVDADGVTTLSTYNDLGELEYTAVDMDRNNRIDLAGSDQVTKSIRDFATQDGSVVVRTRMRAASQSEAEQGGI